MRKLLQWVLGCSLVISVLGPILVFWFWALFGISEDVSTAWVATFTASGSTAFISGLILTEGNIT